MKLVIFAGGLGSRLSEETKLKPKPLVEIGNKPKNKKNQLEIEKKEIENKYKILKEDYELMSKKLEEIKDNQKLEERKQIEFSEKIDELNQETDTLLEEIDKWQT